MECVKCKKEYLSPNVLPLSCRCGVTKCKDCVSVEAVDETYQCHGCGAKSLVKDLVVNRSLGEIIQIIHRVSGTKCESKKKAKVFVEVLHEHSEKSKAAHKEQGIVYFHRSAEAKKESESEYAQTVQSLLTLERVSRKELGVNIHWDMCFFIPIYFLFQSPWLFYATFEESGGDFKFRRWIGLWLLNFLVFSFLLIVNSDILAEFSFSKLKRWKTRLLVLSIVTEFGILIYGWVMYLQVVKDKFFIEKHFNSALGLIIIGSLFNAFLVVVTLYITISGYPLIHTPRKVQKEKFTFKQSVSIKIIFLLLIFLLPDILIYQSGFDVSKNKYFYFIYFYLQIFELNILIICQNRFKQLSICALIIMLGHLILSISSIVVLEGDHSIYFIYNGFVDFISILITALGVKKFIGELSDKNRRNGYNLI